MTTYRIKNLIGKLETSTCPPSFVSAIFPNFDGSQAVQLVETESGPECHVTFDTPQAPVDLGPTVIVETI